MQALSRSLAWLGSLPNVRPSLGLGCVGFPLRVVIPGPEVCAGRRVILVNHFPCHLGFLALFRLWEVSCPVLGL